MNVTFKMHERPRLTGCWPRQQANFWPLHHLGAALADACAPARLASRLGLHRSVLKAARVASDNTRRNSADKEPARVAAGSQ